MPSFTQPTSEGDSGGAGEGGPWWVAHNTASNKKVVMPIKEALACLDELREEIRNTCIPSEPTREDLARALTSIGWKVDALGTQLQLIAQTPKPNRDNNVMVDQSAKFMPVGPDTPRGMKIQLLTKHGVAVYGHFDGDMDSWVGWYPVPRGL